MLTSWREGGKGSPKEGLAIHTDGRMMKKGVDSSPRREGEGPKGGNRKNWIRGSLSNRAVDDGLFVLMGAL